MKKIERKLHKIDATGQAIGRLASQIAILLRGKNKIDYEPRIDGGDIVEVDNIKNVKIHVKRLDQKKYYSYSGYPGGLKTKTLKDFFNSNPAEVLRKAVTNMLPDNRLRKSMLKRLIIK